MNAKLPLQSSVLLDSVSHTEMPKKINSDAVSGFGERLATLRKAAGISQTAFAQEIGISQRMMAYYESTTAHPPSALLPLMASTLGVSVDALLGIETSKRRAKATDTRLIRRLQQIEKLPSQEKRQLLQLIDAFIERWQLKNKIQQKEI
jgi:transcriptional regulator with XRE-family HTH domain